MKYFTVGESIYHGRITKEEALKLQGLYIKYFKVADYILCADYQRRRFKVVGSIYQVF